MSPCVNLIGGLIPPWTPGKCSCGGWGRWGNERPGEGRGLMFTMETSRRAQQPWRERARSGWMTRNLSPPRGPGLNWPPEGPLCSGARPGPDPVLQTDVLTTALVGWPASYRR